MRYLLLTVFFYGIHILVKAQNSDSLIAEIRSVNKAVTDKPVNAGNAATISNRAMNIFMADKTGYLSESGDLSFYTNYVTLNSSLGRITINHNFQKATGIDEPVKKLPSVGIGVYLPVSFANSFLDNRFDNGLGITVSYKWLGKIKTHFANAVPMQHNPDQKKVMDALRAAIVHTLETEISKKAADFKMALAAVDTADVPWQDIMKARELMQQDFYENLKEEYEEKFASLQAAALTKTNNFKLISSSWTSINTYIPLLSPDYFVATSLNTAFEHKHSYPLQLTLSHTRLLESAKAGRLFVTIDGSFLFNNSKLSYGLNKADLEDSLGGSDNFHAAALKNNKAYIGNYDTYFSPSLQGRFVYFPANSHIGISFLIQQNFGSYNLLNSKISIPVVLINSKKTPAATFDFYVLFLDMNNKIKVATAIAGKTIVGLSVGIPFSRLMY